MSLNPNKPADFKPITKGYKYYDKFRFWCQQILPLTFDDSLSYYELLNKLLEYLNSTIDNLESMETNIDKLYEAYKLLENYVNSYFENLDITEEINDKINSLIEDGTFDDLIINSGALETCVNRWMGSNATQKIIPTVNTWMNENGSSEISDNIDRLVDNGTIKNIIEDSGKVESSTKEWLNENEDSILQEVDDWLDVNSEEKISNKVDELVDDGTISDLIEETGEISSATTQWLNTNVNPVGSAVTIDSSLTISGSAGDSKIIGDKFKQLSNFNSENLFFPTIKPKETRNGVTIETNGDGYIHISGTCTDTTLISIMGAAISTELILPPGTYCRKGYSEGDTNGVYLNYQYNGGSAVTWGNNSVVTITENCRCYVRVNTNFSGYAKIAFGIYETSDANDIPLQYNPRYTADDEISRRKISYLSTESCGIFKKVVCIGDSYTSGYIKLAGMSEPERYNKNFAYPYYLSKITGNEWVNIGVSGSNTRAWVNEHTNLIINAGKTQAYVIGLMINDSNTSISSYVELGSASDIGTNANTFYRYYSDLINYINETAFQTLGYTNSYKPKIFINTCPQNNDNNHNFVAYNNALREIYNIMKVNIPNLHLIDLKKNQMQYYTNDLLKNDLTNNHYTAIGYHYFAKVYDIILSKYIDDNINEFKDVAFIECE